MSLGRGATDGVRDHATLLAEALERENVACSMHWLARTEGSMLASRAQIRAWTRALVDELAESRPRVILLHYSVFAYAHRGLPLFVHPTVSAVRRLKIPVLTMLHELVNPRVLAAKGVAPNRGGPAGRGHASLGGGHRHDRGSREVARLPAMAGAP